MPASIFAPETTLPGSWQPFNLRLWRSVSDLDRKAAESIFDLPAELNSQGCAVVVATYDLRILDRAPTKLRIEDGRIVEEE